MLVYAATGTSGLVFRFSVKELVLLYLGEIVGQRGPVEPERTPSTVPHSNENIFVFGYAATRSSKADEQPRPSPSLSSQARCQVKPSKGK